MCAWGEIDNIAVYRYWKCMGMKAVTLLFPEGTDLSKSNLKKSEAFADKNNLPQYKQVTHRS